MASLSNNLTLKFQREINRISDSDRNTRKSGLKKLLENLPWNSTSEDEVNELRQTCQEVLFSPLLNTLEDQVEKCRECTIALFSKIVQLFDKSLELELLEKLAKALCSRINTTPFPEKSEEIRFQVIQLIRALCPLIFSDDLPPSFFKGMADVIVQAIGKALVDQFPDVKKACGEVIIDIGKLTMVDSIRIHYKGLLKGLVANAAHQHYKVRSLSIKALSTVLCRLASDITREKDFLTAIQDEFSPLLQKLIADRSTSPRKSTVFLLGNLIAKRVEMGSWFNPTGTAAKAILSTVAPGGTASGGNDHLAVASKTFTPPNPPEDLHKDVEMDPEVSSHRAAALDTLMLSNLVVMLGDNDENVRASGIKHLKKISVAWSKKDENVDALPFVRAFAPFVLHNISGAILTSWTTENKSRQINALTALIVAVRNLCEYTHRDEIQDAKNDGGDGECKMEIDDDNNDDVNHLMQRQRITSELLTSKLLPQIFDALASTARDETIEIRQATEACCVSIGYTIANAANCILDEEEIYSEGVNAIIAYLVPRVRGELAGLDTAYHRTSALSLLTHIIQGIGSVESTSATTRANDFIAELCVREISASIADPTLHEFREASLRESALLLIRQMYKASLSFTKACVESKDYQCNFYQALVYLCGRCSFEEYNIPRAAKKQIAQFAETMESKNPYASTEEKIVNELSVHFQRILNTITFATNTNDNVSKRKIHSTPDAKPCVYWTPASAHRAAFEALIRECPRAAWQHHDVVIKDVIVPLVQPPEALVKGTPEEIAATYAAQRGDLSYDGTQQDGSVDTRLSMLALLETMLRAGSSDWECSAHISACCDMLVEKVFIPNLVWRAGRVESVARKVTLTATHGLLKAGAVGPQSLYKHAPHVVPLLASEMEDSDASSRHLSCLCLSIVFERLRGGFDEQAILDLYPRLLKRLDDSDDIIRMAVCDTFKPFMLCAPKEVYRGTMITYTLDQLFIHLDDPDPKIQKCIFDVLLHIAEHVDTPLVLKKANANVQTHRSPVMCEAVIRAVNKLTN